MFSAWLKKKSLVYSTSLNNALKHAGIYSTVKCLFMMTLMENVSTNKQNLQAVLKESEFQLGSLCTKLLLLMDLIEQTTHLIDHKKSD
jgi:hypothetical protein